MRRPGMRPLVPVLDVCCHPDSFLLTHSYYFIPFDINEINTCLYPIDVGCWGGRILRVYSCYLLGSQGWR